jgi:hypothetical protein
VARFDPLRNGTLDEKEAELPDDHGVLVVHVHGSLEDDARYGFLETLPNHPEIWSTVAPLLRYDTVICGASLTGDLDVADVMQRVSNRDRDDAATWLFNRPGGGSPLVPIPSGWQRVDSQRVDFNDLMIILAEEALAAAGQMLTRWSELVDALPHLDLPRDPLLVELAPAVRRNALAAKVAGLVAPPFSGKSVGAVRLAHLRRLIDGVEQPLRVSLDPQDSPAELAISVARGDVVVVIDDPFGSNDAQVNPRVRDFLMALREENGGYACVSSPIANWEAAAGPLLEKHRGLYVAPSQPASWYERFRLTRLAEQLPHHKAASRRARSGELQTPPEVLELGRNGRLVNRRRLVADKRRLLEKNRLLGLMCTMVRLQERRASPISPAELTTILGCSPDEIPGGEALLSRQQLNLTPYWILNHPTSAEATDAYLKEHLQEFRTLIDEGLFPPWVERCLATWSLASGLPGSVADDIDSTEELEPADWMAQRLGSHPTEAQLASMELDPRDAWATIEFAYELVRVWDSIRTLPTARRLLRDLTSRPMGIYALLEGCLYFDLGASDELWTRVMDQLYQLADDPDRSFELLLSLDAVMWRVPGHESLIDWAGEAINHIDPRSSDFAIVRFGSGYHPSGLAALDVQQALDLDLERSWTPDQATAGGRLVAWHFGHQSRSRVLLHRRGDIDKEWLCQALGQIEEGDNHQAERLRLIRSLSEFPHAAGWAFHLGCNLEVVSTFDLREEAARSAAENALRKAPPLDPGVLSAVVAYRSADLFSRILSERFEDKAELAALLRTMGQGLEVVDGVFVGPPRFRFIHDPKLVHDAVGQKWPDLDSELPREPEALAAGLWTAAGKLLRGREGRIKDRIMAMIEQVERGDFRPMLLSARGVPRSSDPFEGAILRMMHHPEFDVGDQRLF